MSEVEVLTVNDGSMMKQFLALPGNIYADDPLWVQPLGLLERDEYKKGQNAVLSRSEHILLLAMKNGKPVGRLIAYIDPRYNSFHKSRTGFFGNFESTDDRTVSDALFREAEKWLKMRGTVDLIGPINPVAESWGFVLEGDTPPVFMSPHNPHYYNRLMSLSGFSKAKDLLVYEADASKGYVIPERFTQFCDTLLKRKENITVRMIDKRHLKEDALHILRILNYSISGNWGFVPVEEDEMTGIMNQLKMILDREAVWFVEDEGFPVGVALGFPDINVLFREFGGRLTLPNIWRLITGRKGITDYRLWGLAILPEYHGLGLDVLLYVSLFRALEPRKIRLEANYILEDNPKILNALEKMELKQIKKYRVYSKEL